MRVTSWFKPAVVIFGIIGVGAIFGLLDTQREDMIVIVLVLCCITVFQADQLSAAVCIAVSIVIDWYELISPPLRAHVIAVLLGVIVLCVVTIRNSSHPSWAWPRMSWLWVMLLIVAIRPLLLGMDQSVYPAQSQSYYVNIFLGGFVFFSLGNILTFNMSVAHRIFEYLSAIATLLAIHTIIEATTGVFLLPSSYINDYLSVRSDFQFSYSSATRAGSLLLNPDWNGTFFAIMVFIALALLSSHSSLIMKFVHASEVMLMLIALLFTYSAGAWAAVMVGLAVFVVFVGHLYYRYIIPTAVGIAFAIISLVFSSQVVLLLQHAADPKESALRFGAWETAVNIIRAHPMTGIGFGLYTYLYRAEPYRVPAQYRPLAHPHNSYLELAASGGLPVAVIYVAIIGIALWYAVRTWTISGAEYRPMLGGGIAAICAISANSVTINAWTLAPLAAIAWLILGMLSSPRLLRAMEQSQISKAREGRKSRGLEVIDEQNLAQIAAHADQLS